MVLEFFVGRKNIKADVNLHLIFQICGECGWLECNPNFGSGKMVSCLPSMDVLKAPFYIHVILGSQLFYGRGSGFKNSCERI